MKIKQFLLIISVLFIDFLELSKSLGTKEDDLIQNLPGLIFDPGVKQYSGYFSLSSGNVLHYWYA